MAYKLRHDLPNEVRLKILAKNLEKSKISWKLSLVTTVSSKNYLLALALKNYTKGDIKAFCSCPICFLDFSKIICRYCWYCDLTLLMFICLFSVLLIISPPVTENIKLFCAFVNLYWKLFCTMQNIWWLYK